MTFSDGDKALIRETSYEVGRLLLAEFEDRVDDKIDKHGLKCDAREVLRTVKGSIRGMASLYSLLAAFFGVFAAFSTLKWTGQLSWPVQIVQPKEKESEVKNEKSSSAIDHRLGRLRGGPDGGR